MDTDFFQDLQTKKEAILFIEKLSQVANSMYRIQSSLASSLDQILTVREKNSLIDYCRQKHINMEDPVKFQKVVASLKDEVNIVPILSLQIAVEPTPVLVDKISKWISQNLKEKYFLDIKFDPSLIAGAVIVANGTYKDHSLKKYIDENYGNKQLVS